MRTGDESSQAQADSVCGSGIRGEAKNITVTLTSESRFKLVFRRMNMEYTIVKGFDVGELITEVTKYISEGWTPLGGVFVNKMGFYGQAMTKHEPLPQFTHLVSVIDEEGWLEKIAKRIGEKVRSHAAQGGI
jgi:hypothetical protein